MDTVCNLKARYALLALLALPVEAQVVAPEDSVRQISLVQRWSLFGTERHLDLWQQPGSISGRFWYTARDTANLAAFVRNTSCRPGAVSKDRPRECVPDQGQLPWSTLLAELDASGITSEPVDTTSSHSCVDGFPWSITIRRGGAPPVTTSARGCGRNPEDPRDAVVARVWQMADSSARTRPN